MIGAISAHSAMKLAFYRGALSEKLALCGHCNGSMLAVGLSEMETNEYLERLISRFGKLKVKIGCINSPKSVTLSGDRVQIHALEAEFRSDGIFARELRVPLAYHSQQMHTIATGYKDAVRIIEKGDDRFNGITMMSSVTAAPVSLEQLRDPNYWVANLESPVEFYAALSRAVDKPVNVLKGPSKLLSTTFLEVGPHCALKGPIHTIMDVHGKEGHSWLYRSLLRRSQSGVQCMMNTMGELYCAGLTVDISSVNRLGTVSQRHPMLLTNLPPYSFDHSNTYWEESRISKATRFREHNHHTLLGNAVSDWNSLEPRWCNKIRPDRLPYVEDHKVSHAVHPVLVSL
jgi:acyl transferase domain-containing protein